MSDELKDQDVANDGSRTLRDRIVGFSMLAVIFVIGYSMKVSEENNHLLNQKPETAKSEYSEYFVEGKAFSDIGYNMEMMERAKIVFIPSASVVKIELMDRVSGELNSIDIINAYPRASSQR
jgi:hypothetical protein